jgi:1-acyl-sn-glycerol-3-phosphate acyltransferase
LKEPKPVPTVADSVPQRGNRLSRGIARFILARCGWRFEGVFPDLPKCVLVVAPHTSNWDFMVGMCAMFALGIRVCWLGKHTVFRWPFGGLMRWLGGIAVDRRTRSGVVEQTVATFAARDRLLLGIAPEGTRSKVKRWRTGFYYIALGAEVPILLVSFVYSRRVISLGPILVPGGDVSSDLERLQAFAASGGGACGNAVDQADTAPDSKPSENTPPSESPCRKT